MDVSIPTSVKIFLIREPIVELTIGKNMPCRVVTLRKTRLTLPRYTSVNMYLHTVSKFRYLPGTKFSKAVPVVVLVDLADLPVHVHVTVSKRYKNLFPVPVPSKYLSEWYQKIHTVRYIRASRY